MGRGASVAWPDRGRVHQSCLGEQYESNLLPATTLSFWSAAGSLSLLAFPHPKNRPRRGLFHPELAVVPRLARHLPVPGQILVDPVGKNFVFYERPGCLSRRMAPKLPSEPHRKSPRRTARQHGCVDRAGRPLSDSPEADFTAWSATGNFLKYQARGLERSNQGQTLYRKERKEGRKVRKGSERLTPDDRRLFSVHGIVLGHDPLAVLSLQGHRE
jgi:hypothetical protein